METLYQVNESDAGKDAVIEAVTNLMAFLSLWINIHIVAIDTKYSVEA